MKQIVVALDCNSLDVINFEGSVTNGLRLIKLFH